MAVTNRIQQGRTVQFFSKVETEKGVLICPTATDFNVIAGQPDFGQQSSFTDSTEIRNSRSLVDRFQDQRPAGSWSVPMLVRPSGTAGTAPDGAAMLEAAFGTEDIVTDTSVTYSFTMDNDLPTLTIAIGYADVAWWLVGATVNELKLTLTNKGALQLNFSGGYMWDCYAGYTELDDSTGGGASVELASGEAVKFTVGALIQFYTGDAWDDNEDAGYEITAINYDEDTLTLGTSAPALSTGDLVKYYLPASPTEVGESIECRTGTVEFDDVVTKVTSCEATLANNNSYLEDEISSDDNPTDFVSDIRSIKAATNIVLRTDDLIHFRNSRANTQVKIEILGGDEAGKYMAFNIPQAVGDTPAMSGDLQRTAALNFTGLGTTSLEDEATLVFT